MAEQKSGVAMAGRMVFYVAVLPVIVVAVISIGIWAWTSLT